LRSRQKRSLLFVNEYFGGERNTANGTLWTDTNYGNLWIDQVKKKQLLCHEVLWFISSFSPVWICLAG